MLLNSLDRITKYSKDLQCDIPVIGNINFLVFFFFLNPFFRLSAGLQRKGARVKNPNRFDTGF